MRLPAPRARRRSTVLGEPFLRAVSTGTTNATEPPQPVEAPPAQTVDPFRGMVDLLNRCLKAEGEVAEIEDTLARDPDALSPDEIVAPVAAVLADTRADLERMPSGPARRRVVEAARREGLALTDRVLEADARADRRFKEGTITAAADRLAAKVARDPGALDASLTMLNDLIDTADLDASDKRLVAVNLEARVRDAAKPPEPNPDASTMPGEEPASSGQTSSSDAGDTEQVVREGKSDALTSASEAGDIVQVAREGKSDPIRPPPEIAAQIASKIREFQAFLNADRGEGKSIADAQEEFANNIDRQFRKVLRDRLGEGAVAGRDEFNAVFERGYRELQRWLHGEIDRIGERDGYTDEQIADLKIIADTGVVTLGIIGPGGRPGRGGRGGDRDGRDDQDNPENEQRDRDADDGRNEDQSEDGGDGTSRTDTEDSQSSRFSVDELRQRSPNDAGSFSNKNFASDEDYLRYRRIVRSGVPRGFKDREHFETVGEKFWEELAGGDGFENARFAIRGSAVTGRKFDTRTKKYEGPLFDTAGKGDFDLAVVDDNLLKRAFRFRKQLRIGFRQGGTRTTPLTSDQVRRLGLDGLAKEMDALATESNRTVEIMIYESDQSLWVRGQAMWLPKGE